jgi:hypothetical protein
MLWPPVFQDGRLFAWGFVWNAGRRLRPRRRVWAMLPACLNDPDLFTRMRWTKVQLPQQLVEHRLQFGVGLVRPLRDLLTDSFDPCVALQNIPNGARSGVVIHR